MKTILKLPRLFLVALLGIYQKTLSPDHGWFSPLFSGGCCRYHPTCSEYGKGAIMKYGVLRGGCMTVWRLMRCNPWSKGGVDDVR